jgi:hypothetical protein
MAWGCETGKISFPSIADAVEGLRIAPGGEEMVAYRCPRCEWWHIGHPNKQYLDPLAPIPMIKGREDPKS